MRADDFLNEADEESRKDNAMAAAMANVMKQKAEIDAKNAEVEKSNSERSAPEAPKYSVDDYKTLLARHDWFYNYSDDHSVWSRGSDERDQLYKYQDAIDPDYNIWNEYSPEMYQRKKDNVEEQDFATVAKAMKGQFGHDQKVRTKTTGQNANGIIAKATKAVKDLFNDVENDTTAINEKKKKKVKQRLDPKCWDGKKKDGTKIKGGVRVNNCVPK